MENEYEARSPQPRVTGRYGTTQAANNLSPSLPVGFAQGFVKGFVVDERGNERARGSGIEVFQLLDDLFLSAWLVENPATLKRIQFTKKIGPQLSVFPLFVPFFLDLLHCPSVRQG